MKKIVILLILLSFISKAQNVISTSAHFSTKIDEQLVVAPDVISYLFYDDGKEELILKIDLEKTLNLRDSVYDWLVDLDSTTLYFVGNLSKQVFVPLPNGISKKVNVQGDIYLNDISMSSNTEILIFQFKDESLTSSVTNGNNYDTYKVDFSIEISPQNFKIDKGKHRLKDPILISVESGRINQLRPESNSLLKDLNRK